MSRSAKRRVGDILMIPLDATNFAFAQILQDPLIAFFDVRADHQLSIEEILRKHPIFCVWVMHDAVKKGGWTVIGHAEVQPSLQQMPLFFKKDMITGELTLTHDGADEIPVGNADITKLERAAVWEPEHVVDRLNDHFAGRPNIWAQQLR